MANCYSWQNFEKQQALFTRKGAAAGKFFQQRFSRDGFHTNFWGMRFSLFVAKRLSPLGGVSDTASSLRLRSYAMWRI